MIKRLKDCRELDDIVICAPSEPESERLKKVCDEEGVKLYIYPGDVNDVVGRLTSAAKLYNADICVLASGDCPLLSSETIDRLVKFLRENPEYSRVCISPKGGRGVIHEGIGVARREVWELCDKLSDTPELREHQFPVMSLYPEEFERFKTAFIEDEDIFYSLNHRISVDTPSDLKFMNVLYNELKANGMNFNLRNAINILQKKPEIMRINSSVKRKGLKDKNFKAAFIVSAVREFGFGNLMRSLEIADELANRGIGVRFFVLDAAAKSICQKRYFSAEIIEDILSINKADIISNFNIVVFDINSKINLSKSIIKDIKSRGAKTVVIDNSSEGSEECDLVIIPTAHYTGEVRENMIYGPEFVVIRKEVQNIDRCKSERSGVVVRVSDKFKEHVLNTWGKVEIISSFTHDFAHKLAKAQIAILHLGLSCYEAIYLNTPVIVIPRGEDEIPEISAFYRFCMSRDIEKLGDGASRIAEILERLLK